MKVPYSAPAAEKAGYIAGIDGLRAIAVLAVMIFHLGSIPAFKGGFSGVDVFFVISGYVIAKSLFREKDEKIAGYLGNFYKRRILRIVPALVVCLTVTFAAAVLFIPSDRLSDAIGKTGSAAYFGVSNFALLLFGDGYYSPKAEFNPFLHTWSLGSEEQFYLLFPLLLYIFLRFSKRGGFKGFGANWLLPFLAVLSLAAAAILTPLNRDAAYYLLPGRLWELMAGAVLFQFHSRGRLKPASRTVSQLTVGTGLAMIVLGFFVCDPEGFPFPYALIPVAGTILAIAGLGGGKEKSGLVRFPDSRLLIFIGRISYSLYLWHWPLASLMRWTIGLDTPLLKITYFAITFLLASLSYFLIEQPVRRNRKLLNLSYRWIIIGGAAVLALCWGGAMVLAREKQALGLSVTENSYIWRPWGHYRDKAQTPDEESSRFSGKTIFAFGDSHAAAYRTMLTIVSTQLGVESSVFERGDCAVPSLQRPIAEIPGWKKYYEKSLRKLRETALPGDIILLAGLRMPELAYRFEKADVGAITKQYFSPESTDKRAVALREADGIISDLENIGLRVVIEAPLPVLLIPPYRCSDWFNRGNPIADPGPVVSRTLLERFRRPVLDSIAALTANHPRLEVWDPFPVLCTQEEFSAYDEDGLPLFYDGDHLSGNGNRKLAPSFKAKVLSIWTESF